MLLYAPDYPLLFIKIVCRNSNDHSFKKTKFLRYLKKYAEVGGGNCRRLKRLTPECKVYSIMQGMRKRRWIDLFRRTGKDSLCLKMTTFKNDNN